MSFIKTILSSFKNIHFQSLLGNGVMAIFGVVTIAILYRALPFKEIGVYVFFMTVWGLVDTTRSGFLTNAFIKFYSGTAKERADEVVASTWCLALSITGCCVFVNIITFFLSHYITNEGMTLFLKYFSLISVATLPLFMANLVVQGDKRFDRLLWLRMINQILFMGTVIVLIFLKKASLTAIVLTFIGSNAIASMSVLILGWTRFGAISKVTKSGLLEIFHFGKYSVGSGLSANLFKVTDTFFINFFLGPSALAIYSLGGRLMQIIEIPLLSFAASGMPSLSAHYNNNQKEEMMYVMKKMIGMLSVCIIGIACVSIIFAEPIIGLIGGAKYMDTEAPNLFRIFMTMAILFPADRFFSLTLDVIHLPKINFYKLLIMLAVNFTGDLIGIYLFKSVYAVAVADVLPVIIAIIIAYYPLNRYYRFNFWEIYVVGYKEVILFIKQIYFTLFTRDKTANY
ncbi:Membrane protein involved in the export of O-antigen and teichoic acid [Pedobacter sp. ok626]|uniref:lipopolysaccharide biosynthesis protein n=1 Tax=Pedobacter sp. ok626 TaxID=1761882 RepID=UPI000890DB7B|nr:oligosaccharide flippase family protein [Pedobacter sp. ok626]SDJ56689.1 Membrane protein involved in the export of O-antigen and teichoic acid [Pedobacter sp. ok626]